ncbi:WYL domain-containing protein [Gordonia sp. CPCC 205515]|uniref:helix-turn-helix transcriptional regulator n=1 Tax=Gordonia sp. CPCC 205515 TaxID=3140791 RepID=UPI003AF3E2DB
MATQKAERLLNLVICLLSSKQFVTADYIRRNITGYNDDAQSDDAFNRMFERDKNELRDLGIPLVTGRDRLAAGSDGYRIMREHYDLPDISLDHAEAAIVAMAAAWWSTPEVSTITQTALLKLRAAGIDVRADDDDEIGFSAALSPRSVGSESALAAMLSAIGDAQPVTFAYRPGAAAASTTRTLEPWGVATYRGRWYVVGHDRDRAATRTFRLSRVAEVTPIDDPGDVTVPGDIDLQQIVSSAVDSAAGSDGGTAQIWVARDRAAGLRRIAVTTTPRELDGDQGDVLEIEIRSLGTLTRMVLGAGADAVALAPAELVGEVVAGLDTLVGVSIR